MARLPTLRPMEVPRVTGPVVVNSYITLILPSGRHTPGNLHQALGSVLMAGAHACSHPLVANDRHAVQNILFRRASMLYHMRHESDRMHLLQAAALFTWHIGDGDTVAGGPWYWAGIAVRIGTGLGAHRKSSQLPAAEMAQYRRCWWSAFFCEVFSALETGRPCAVRAEDIDQIPLRQEDMADTATTDPSMVETPGEIRTAVTSQTFLVAINALERLSRLLRCTILLARHWPNAEAVHSVLEELHREYETLVSQRLQGEQVMVPESPPDWNRLLGAEGVHQFNSFTSDQDWMNINSWTDLL
ncbi:hypothetical protein FGSG_12115 [Fusarium graminearum PH-1]|uniref:hypothetical protein n=1 Tax=Gibberella zeae (strain ATCC MYA-4620 / CBS 123657 / FGSC 9075 / NRRL 31084 / PH-1) TaxID=229533 RepID=UPI00021F1479|nr:hypothetical protein FGSG_12115 [Fusarium graminearum PH-1]ESU07703.1 hypothetical protein FGSG_12115 [Fusarium graminearum PH-1]|eukprot:XP_011318188.1 hypothetical protein FGSG_12115 [Fusarium graminearum PH-1]